MGLVARVAVAECRPPESCVDPEALWLPPAATRFVGISDPGVMAPGAASGSAVLSFRLRPAVFTVPAPNRDGRDVNVISHATDVSLAARWGVGHRLELTVAAPAGLYQRGAGIKGVTSQAADAVAAFGLHDPRLGFALALPTRSSWLSAKLRFEAKLPLGSSASVATESGPVSSPSLAIQAERRGWFAGAELGARLRRADELLGLRVGSQALIALGVGRRLAEPRLTFALEAYALPSLIDSGPRASTPSEWLVSAALAPRALPALTFGAAGGGGLPLSADAAGTRLAYGVPTLRALVFVRLAPAP